MAVRDVLAKMKDTITIDRDVPLEYEVSKILAENQTTPVIFKNLAGMRAAGNIWSTRERISGALDITKEQLIPKMLEAMANPSEPKVAKEGAFMDDVRTEFDLTKLPIPKYFPGDQGRYITSAVAVAEYEGKRNLSFHRMKLHDERSFALRLVPRHLYTMWKNAQAQGKELPVAFCMGVCPPVLLAAAISTDYGTDEMRIANSLRERTKGSGLEVAKLNNGLMVPAASEIVFEGRITSRMVDEGPFMDITGTYDSVRKAPIFEVDRLYMRKDPLFHLLLPGGYEHYMLMGLPREPIIYRTVNQVVPKVHGVRLTEGGCCWLHGVVSITKNKEGDGINAAMAAFSGHPSMKKVTIVDEDIDIFDDRDVEWAEATRFQASRSLMVVNNAAGSSLDPSSEGTTSKVAIDATKPFGAKGFDRAKLA
ncbi:UbiD family decarboxylase [Methanomassiliicoccus luminyensis]|uniref:UbiD family decarboxylase n=1 Tax=Methanomassiliicoccus luminyensis TaxID=1080712 RepID=UPI00036F3DD5|nr:UbiD family decarboxylase [Methanomassiliicoccus luminyensis]